jgi:hypothetical protein
MSIITSCVGMFCHKYLRKWWQLTAILVIVICCSGEGRAPGPASAGYPDIVLYCDGPYLSDFVEIYIEVDYEHPSRFLIRGPNEKDIELHEITTENVQETFPDGTFGESFDHEKEYDCNIGHFKFKGEHLSLLRMDKEQRPRVWVKSTMKMLELPATLEQVKQLLGEPERINQVQTTRGCGCLY